jgi:Ring finger domain
LDEGKGRPLRVWLIVLSGLNFVNLLFTLRIYIGLPQINESYAAQRTKIQTVIKWSVVNRCIDIGWFIWSVMGGAWTFTTSGGNCREDSPIWVACVVFFAVHMALLCVGCCCCCTTCFRVLSRIVDEEGGAPPGASKKEIKSNTRTVRFSSSNAMVEGDTEHNVCGICLEDYGSGEELRVLNCKHHFHTKCIDNWLTRSKSCPYCKKVIDAEVSEDDGEDVDPEEISIDGV